MITVNKYTFLVFIVVCLCMPADFYGQQKQPQTITAIGREVASYKGKQVTLKLRLKTKQTPPYGPDKPWIFTFYDQKNINIRFTVDELKHKNKFRKIVGDLRRGVFYNVTFIVEKYDNEELIGTLLRISPAFLGELP